MDGKILLIHSTIESILFFRILCFNTGDDDEGEVKVMIDHPLMKTVYAITSDANKRI